MSPASFLFVSLEIYVVLLSQIYLCSLRIIIGREEFLSVAANGNCHSIINDYYCLVCVLRKVKNLILKDFFSDEIILKVKYHRDKKDRINWFPHTSAPFAQFVSFFSCFNHHQSRTQLSSKKKSHLTDLKRNNSFESILLLFDSASLEWMREAAEKRDEKN